MSIFPVSGLILNKHPPMSDFQQEFIKNSIYRMDESLRMLRICFSELTDEQIGIKPNSAANSVANLILHICGNMRQYAVAGLGNLPDTRNREEEFTRSEGYSGAELLQKLEETISEVKATLLASSSENWLTVKKVQGFEFSGVGLVLHVVEHLSYHTGQIALITKQFLEKPLGFYSGIDLNLAND